MTNSGMAERSIALVLKTSGRKARGFESLSRCYRSVALRRYQRKELMTAVATTQRKRRCDRTAADYVCEALERVERATAEGIHKYINDTLNEDVGPAAVRGALPKLVRVGKVQIVDRKGVSARGRATRRYRLALKPKNARARS